MAIVAKVVLNSAPGAGDGIVSAVTTKNEAVPSCFAIVAWES